MCYYNNCATLNSPSRSFHKSNFLVVIVIAESYKLTTCDSRQQPRNSLACLAVAIVIDFAFAVIFAVTWLYESSFIIAIATAFALTEFYEIAIAAAFAIAFEILLQSETVLSSLIHFDDSIY